jgi:hypothetical protein
MYCRLLGLHSASDFARAIPLPGAPLASGGFRKGGDGLFKRTAGVGYAPP